MNPMTRLLLLMATRTYRAKAFMRAAHKLGAEVIVGSERRQALSRMAPGGTLTLDLRHPERAAAAIVAYARERPLRAIVGVDDDTTLVAALASAALGLPGNAPRSVEAAQNKYRMRSLLAAAGVPSPWFELISTSEDAGAVAPRLRYPCVLKPVFLSASRGVIRADDADGFVRAFARVCRILADPEVVSLGGEWAGKILVEGFIPGFEVALEGLLEGGTLRTLALFDKPDPLDGPFFEETIYVTPSRLSAAAQAAVRESTARTAAALGLREGPVHAELRVNEAGAWIVEIAARSIGGLCSNTLQFGAGISLEELLLRHAVGADISAFTREKVPAGVMMLPIPRAGILQAIRGREAAEQVSGVHGVEITIPVGQEVVPLPEGTRYLGFIFAGGESTDAVEAAVRAPHRRLARLIDPPAAAG